MKRCLVPAISALCFAALAIDSVPAHACGGTFCDSGPTSMPVDQSGENILFVMDGPYVEAHVQIQYEGDAERFAWIVPMQKIPEVKVGSQPLFSNLLNRTVPTYGFSQSFDVCEVNGGNGGSTVTGSGGTSSTGGSGAGGAGGGPNVVLQKTVGSFDVTVLEGGSAQQIVTWLETNGYQNAPGAADLLEDYVQKNYVFAAVKLTADTGADEIHPLVFRYEGNEPCVPIKLTAVAATENMGIRAFFLGDDRVVPTNYKHVTLNPVRVDWLSFGDNYNQVVTRAVDSTIANGHAFTTEYAGPSNIISTAGVFDPQWNASAYRTLAPEQLIDTLSSQGFGRCWEFEGCQFTHPLVMPLVAKYLPVPASLTPEEFYACPSCYVDLIDDGAWDANLLADDFQARIIDPGKRATDLLALYPYLTRMFTTMSPAEMTEDPMFHAKPGLDDVNLSGFANLRVTCDNDQGMILPDGRNVALPNGWPAFDSNMPWAERIEEYPIDGDPIVLVDNTEQIDAELKSHNTESGWVPLGGGGNGNGGSSGVGGNGAGNSGGTTAAGPDDRGSTSGCACSLPTSSDGSPLAAGLGAFALGFVGLRLRRRRRQASRG